MVNFLLELIDFNEGIDYAVVSRIVIIYLVLLWFFVSIWVFNDAKYRFNNLLLALVLGILNLVLSFPFLLIYLLIRPSHREDWDEYGEDGGINIPLVNFTDKEGIAISLHLKIDSKKLTDQSSDYKLDVSLNRDNGDEIVVENVQTILKPELVGKRERLDQVKSSVTTKIAGFRRATQEGFRKIDVRKALPKLKKRNANVTLTSDEKRNVNASMVAKTKSKIDKKKNKNKKKRRK
jgi:hypothetical protein